MHLRSHSSLSFWETNVTGTFNVLQAARELGVGRIVLCSSLAVYGAAARPIGGRWVRVTETVTPQPTHVYGLTKVLNEEMGRYQARTAGGSVTALRLGNFVPTDDLFAYGLRLLSDGLDADDAAYAAMLAVNRSPEGSFECLNVCASAPFELGVLNANPDPAAVFERRWPGSIDVLGAHGVDLRSLLSRRVLWSVDRAQHVLGFRSRVTFEMFMMGLLAGKAGDAVAVRTERR